MNEATADRCDLRSTFPNSIAGREMISNPVKALGSHVHKLAGGRTIDVLERQWSDPEAEACGRVLLNRLIRQSSIKGKVKHFFRATEDSAPHTELQGTLPLWSLPLRSPKAKPAEFTSLSAPEIVSNFPLKTLLQVIEIKFLSLHSYSLLDANTKTLTFRVSAASPVQAQGANTVLFDLQG